MSARFKNFELAHRLPNLVLFGLLPTGDLSWIDTNFSPGGAPYSEVPTGTKDGVNKVFTVLNQNYVRTHIIRNTQTLLEELGDYTLVNGTITFATAPHAIDSVVFWGWALPAP